MQKFMETAKYFLTGAVIALVAISFVLDVWSVVIR